MIDRRTVVSLVVSASVLIVAGAALAKNAHHSDGHNLLGAKLGQNGKHEIGRIGNSAVTAEVNNKKVVGMSAGNLPVRKVKSNKKMAGLDHLQVAANGEIQLAQIADVYYGYCFDTGLDEYCYWYPASDVVVTDTWIVYSS
jgi:TRAP-type mannitol/chloroaromatic compound transport system substrate-binding protein